jgi:hypothetical protein
MMVTFEQALEKATELLDYPPKTCYDYEQGYRFLDGVDAYGGNHQVVIIKENGMAVSFARFINEFHPDPKLHRIPIKKKVRK